MSMSVHIHFYEVLVSRMLEFHPFGSAWNGYREFAYMTAGEVQRTADGLLTVEHQGAAWSLGGFGSPVVEYPKEDSRFPPEVHFHLRTDRENVSRLREAGFSIIY